MCPQVRPINNWEVRERKTKEEWALWDAAEDGDTDRVQQLLLQGVNPNVKDQCKYRMCRVCSGLSPSLIESQKGG